jgi:hypothetical protein
VTESISAIFQVRWTKLEQGLRELFLNSGGDDAANAEGQVLWEAFRTNPRIKALWKQTGRFGARGPSYIPPRVLALTLLDTLAPRPEGNSGGNAAQTKQTAAAAKTKGKQMARDHDLVARAERAAGSVRNPLLRKWLLDALTEIDVDREKLLTSLESSFDGVMNRVSGWYKRYAAIVVAVLAFAAALALNVDSYAIGSRLWKDDAVRNAIAAQAANVTADQCTQPADTTKPGKGGTVGTSGSANTSGATGTASASGATGVTGAPGASGAGGTTVTASAAQPTFSLELATQCVTRLHALALPIGWGKENRPTGWGWASKPFGIIVTGFALMLGAPFWFDTLSRIARLRSSGNPEGTTKKNG